jgi:pimeloyl-ACP methyl ester carboxylesterase
MSTIPKEITIKTQYLKLAAQVWGPEEGHPILALHGWLDNAATFTPLASLLPQLRLTALDLPGHGLSEQRPAGVHYHFIDFIPDVIAAADALGWRQFSLLGHSLGAGIASFVAAVIPDRIRGLALIEGLGPLSGNPDDGPVALSRAMKQMMQLNDKRLPHYANLDEAIQARRAAGKVSWEIAATLASRGTKAVEGGIGWRSDPRLTFKSPVYLMEEQVLAYLSRIETPTLLLRGESGYLQKRPFMRERFNRVASLEIKSLPGSHYVHMEVPERVAPMLIDYFASR